MRGLAISPLESSRLDQKGDVWMDFTKVVSDLGIPIASNILLVYIMYQMFKFYVEKVGEMDENISKNTEALMQLKEAIEDVKAKSL